MLQYHRGKVRFLRFVFVEELDFSNLLRVFHLLFTKDMSSIRRCLRKEKKIVTSSKPDISGESSHAGDLTKDMF